MSPSRLVVLQTSPRVAPGLLTAEAWQVLRSAETVICGPANDAQRVAVVAAGVPVVVAEEPLPALLRAAAAGGTAVWLGTPEGDEELAHALAAEVVNRAERGEPAPDIEVVAASYDLPGSRLLDLVAVMDRLRTECPWDRQQTHRSLLRYLVEEAYETVEAVETGDRRHLREELGDLLLQVMFHSRIAEEHPEQPWAIDDVAADIVEKLVRRHPHVFADVEVEGAEDVDANWESIKAEEKQRESVLDGIPPGLPALLMADKVLARASREGAHGLPAPWNGPASETELGEHLLSVVRAARSAGIDAESALRDAVRRLAGRLGSSEGG
ncbi:MAG: MazG family protein [Propionibacteriales bacterium]|nr:MazG family protein [Propionibacteriales bacterium]